MLDYILDYKIISNSNPLETELQVREFLKDGWCLEQRLIVTMTVASNGFMTIIYTQALTKTIKKT